ncbi:hypothetical protein P7C70_g8591, partial [Phenoliferia sp. Uapishka_3]
MELMPIVEVMEELLWKREMNVDGGKERLRKEWAEKGEKSEKEREENWKKELERRRMLEKLREDEVKGEGEGEGDDVEMA